jgi:hypothetical protein
MRGGAARRLLHLVKLALFALYFFPASLPVLGLIESILGVAPKLVQRLL